MSKKIIDLTGLSFGRLSVIKRSGTRTTPNGSKRPIWSCICSCGNTTSVAGDALRNGTTRSCGCLQKEAMRSAAKTHGMSNSPEYQTWRGMIERCTNPKNIRYPKYGGAGIRVTKRWLHFENFYSDMGSRPQGTSLDRYPNHKGDYKPSNCRWATPSQQSRNTERTVMLTFKGISLCRKDWADKLGITTVALKVRLKRWGLSKALMTPKFNRGKHANRNKGT